MPTIIPIPAFTDNYIWLVRDDAFAAAEAQAGRSLAGVVEAFAALREWKNGFR